VTGGAESISNQRRRAAYEVAAPLQAVSVCGPHRRQSPAAACWSIKLAAVADVVRSACPSYSSIGLVRCARVIKYSHISIAPYNFAPGSRGVGHWQCSGQIGHGCVEPTVE